MEAHNILGLRVVRWCRKWSEPGQPYVSFADYTPLSVTTTSVHDSSTLRQWWDDEKDSVKAFIIQNGESFGIETGASEGPLFTAPKEEIEPKAAQIAASAFSPELAEAVLQASTSSASQWFIPPLQDFLYMEKRYWLDNAADERINIPGSVSQFNWTYRLPLDIEELTKDDNLTEKIKALSKARK
jgi:4-alpha-glucanotransferase